MKLIIAFALFAVAFADEIRVVPLPLSPMFSQPSMGQLIVPNYIIDALKVDMPVMREAVLADEEGLTVRFVDAPLDIAAPEPVILGEAPLPAFETADVAAEGAFDAVVVVAPMAEQIAPEPVQIAEAPLPAFETADVDAVRFADAPLEVAPEESVKIGVPTLPVVAPVAEEIAPEPVQIAEAPLPAFETADVDAVRFADAPLEVAPVESVKIGVPILPVVAPVAEEIAPEPVRIAEAPLPAFETVEVDAVRFADAPLDAPEPVKLAEPALPAFETAPVEAVKIAVPQFRDYRFKQFDDPRLR